MSNLPKKAEDKVNVFGIVLVGTSAAILLWATAVALQAYYLNTAGPVESELDQLSLADERRTIQAGQRANLGRLERNEEYAGAAETCYRNPIEVAMANVVADAKAGEETLVPAVGAHDKPTLVAIPGYPSEDGEPAATEGAEPFEVRGRELSTGFTVGFEESGAALADASKQDLARLAEFLAADQSIETLAIVAEHPNAGVARARAQTVRVFLTGQGVAASRLEARGQAGPAEGLWFEVGAAQDEADRPEPTETRPPPGEGPEPEPREETPGGPPAP